MALVTILVYVVMTAVMLYLAVKDIRERRVPNKAIVFLLVLWMAWRVFLAMTDPSTIAASVVSVIAATAICALMLALTALYERFRKHSAMGGGDIKLIATLALYIGVEGLGVCMIVACLVALVFALAASVRTNPMRYGVPFAACLACGTFITLLV